MKKKLLISAILYASSIQASPTIDSVQTNSLFALQLATEYEQNMPIDWQNYLYSEKLDGIRVMWDGFALYTRNYHRIHAPEWFTKDLPNFPIEGELWTGKQQFERVMSIVMDDDPGEGWREVKFMLFDMPYHPLAFIHRYQQLLVIDEKINKEHIDVIRHYPAKNKQHVMTVLDTIVDEGGEGLMLRSESAPYLIGRAHSMIKVKKWQDAEATVISYTQGKGKHQGKMGALQVKMPDGKVFKIGSGFSDEERANPPPINSKITFAFNGYTKNGIPKFARYLRVDQSKQNN